MSLFRLLTVDLKPLWRGFGQLLFQPHAGTGVLVLAGIAVNSPLMFVAALVGGVSSTAVGNALGQNQAYKQGLFGFNGVLLGLAAVLFMQQSWQLWFLIVLGAGGTSLLFGVALRYALPVLSAPYILTLLLMSAVVPFLDTPNDGFLLSWPEWPMISGIVTGIGQMGLQGNVLSALFIATGLVVGGGWKTLRWAVMGSAVGALLCQLLGGEDAALVIGLFSYNSALIGVALGSTPGHSRLSWQPWLGIVLAALLTRYGTEYLSIPMLTAPFVLAMWMVILVNRAAIRWRRKNGCG